MFPKRIYYEPPILEYSIGKQLRERYRDIPWYPIQSHNNIEELRNRENSDFTELKKYLIVGTRKTHKYVTNQKVSDYLVPFTSSGCSAMCLYCYLVCNYNKCSYLRVYVNREEILEKLIARSHKEDCPKTFEIGSNSDLLLEQAVTGSPCAAVETFARHGRGQLTFPSKFADVQPFLALDHRGKTIFRMSVNPQEIIRRVEIGTAPLAKRIEAVNDMSQAGYPVGLLIAPVILVDGWHELYVGMLDTLAALLSPRVKRTMFLEIIFMTYSYVHRAINEQAFPHTMQIFQQERMTGRGRGRYVYRQEYRQEAEHFLRDEIAKRFSCTEILYIV